MLPNNLRFQKILMPHRIRKKINLDIKSKLRSIFALEGKTEDRSVGKSPADIVSLSAKMVCAENATKRRARAEASYK